MARKSVVPPPMKRKRKDYIDASMDEQTEQPQQTRQRKQTRRTEQTQQMPQLPAEAKVRRMHVLPRDVDELIEDLRWKLRLSRSDVVAAAVQALAAKHAE